MFIATVPNRNSPPAILLRESYREGAHVRTRTLANLSSLSAAQIEIMRGALKGEAWVRAEDACTIEQSLPHGHVRAILGTVRRLGLDDMIASKPCRERDIVVGIIAERLLHGTSKLAATRLWHSTTLATELGVRDADVNEVYAAMDWLVARQERIEAKLAARHLSNGSAVYYDLTSSYYEGTHCPLAKYGYGRDGKRGLPIIEYGVLTDRCGRPLAISVYEGGTSDSETVADQLDRVRTTFGLDRVVFVGDRGMLTETQIDLVKTQQGIGWVTALRATAIQKLAAEGCVQMSLFDKRNLAEVRSPEYPDERLVVCYNPMMAEKRKRTRDELLVATEVRLEMVRRTVARRTKTPLGKAEIGLRVGKEVNRYKMGKHFALKIEDGSLSWERKSGSIEKEAALDGIYVIRTSEPASRMSAEDAVRTYKNLAETERVFRGMKGVANHVRPIFHRSVPRVGAHLFVSMLAFYVEWHMREALRPLLFDDEERKEANAVRDPVAAARPSASAQRKKQSRHTEGGQPVHSFRTLLQEMASLCKNRCRFGTGPTAVTAVLTTQPNAFQAEAFRLLKL